MKTFKSEVWHAPDGSWAVRICTYNTRSSWKWTSFIGPYPNREMARKTQFCIKMFILTLGYVG